VRQTPYSTEMVADALREHLEEARSERAKINIQEQFNPPLLDASRPDFVSADDDPLKDDLARADATQFLELPRWRLPASLLYSADIGRSDALRFNLVHVSGTGYGAMTDEVGSFVRAPPVTDTLDIKRHGVRPYMTGVNSALRDLAKGPKVWRDIMADIVMGQHLTLSGQFITVGLQVPITHGDNLEYEGLVFHIETVSHQGRIQPDGSRIFQTILQVSHGVETEERATAARANGASQRQSLFPGTSPTEVDLAGNQRNVTVDEEAR
jgi:hypothetical protein